MSVAEMFDIKPKRFIPATVSDGHIAFENEILRSTVGSELHGTGIPGVEDHDEMGIYIEPPEYVLGFKKMEHYTWRSKPEGVKSEHGDVDLTMYSLRKYMSLAMQGNPTVLLLLFTKPPFRSYAHTFGLNLQEMAPFIVSKRCVPRFQGYLESQRQRLTGEKRGHVPSRPELVEKFGYDTKYAMHALRLAIQGIEILKTYGLQLPMHEDEREFLFAVRKGEFKYETVLAMLQQYSDRLATETAVSTLREEPDVAAVERWMVEAHMKFWKRRELV